jgi:nicotinate-nucleotide pyrophosphorylase (carboxylating)
MNQPTISEINQFLVEDIGTGDITASIISADSMATAEVMTRERMVVCGQAWFDAIFKAINPEITVEWLVVEGDIVTEGTLLCKVSGQAQGLLTGERAALNILQTLSYTATVSSDYAQAVSGTGCKVLDTRKTIPGLRNAQKYAVVCGGCFNHRIGLYDGVLIKENHIMAAGSIAAAISSARKITDVPVEIEVESFAEYKEAIEAKPDRIMLDNFSVPDLIKAVSIKHGDIELEASGDITLENIREIAETGVDYISIGALTKHIQAINLSMRTMMEN